MRGHRVRPSRRITRKNLVVGALLGSKPYLSISYTGEPMTITEALPYTALFGDGFTEDEWCNRLWDCYVVAQESPDQSTQNAAMLWNPEGALIGVDYNHFPTGVEYTDERWERPLKYEVIEHAERNSIFWAAYLGRKTQNATMVAAWAACSDCARAIIQSGVKRLVRHKNATNHANAIAAPGKDWSGSINTADTMMREAGVEIIDIDYVFHEHGRVLEIKHCGELWQP